MNKADIIKEHYRNIGKKAYQVSLAKLSKEQQKENARKGGLKSGESRRKMRELSAVGNSSRTRLVSVIE